MARFLLTTFGSLGDLHPYIAVGRGLRERGHEVTIGSSATYRPKVEGEGLAFQPLGPDMRLLQGDPETMRRAMHPRTGSEYIIRKLILPHLEQAYEETLAAARRADFIVGHCIAFATPIAAEILNKPWFSTALQPQAFLSFHDPPVISGMPFQNWFGSLGPGFWKPFLVFIRRVARLWAEPAIRFRRKLGLSTLRNPILDGMVSPYGTQAWFSKALGQPQPDWPERVAITGFPFYDKQIPGEGVSADLARFLDEGPAPVVFTLGSSAVLTAGEFYTESVKAARRLSARAVLLTGGDPRNQSSEPLPETIFTAEYAPYSELLPRAAATVHQGGVGTTGQALRAGRPMIVVPFSHDQPDNAARIARLGAGRTIPRSKYRADRIARDLKALLSEESYSSAARDAALVMKDEDGVRAACDGLEAALHY